MTVKSSNHDMKFEDACERVYQIIEREKRIQQEQLIYHIPVAAFVHPIGDIVSALTSQGRIVQDVQPYHRNEHVTYLSIAKQKT